MGPQSRPQATCLDTLIRQPQTFDFFQAVRLLEGLELPKTIDLPWSQKISRKTLRSVGYDLAPATEALRFKAFVSFAFSAANVKQCTLLPSTSQNSFSQPVLEVSIGNFLGAGGTLPYHYTEEILERIRYGDLALKDFLDIFNHRISSFFYRAWAKNRIYMHFERSQKYESPHDVTKLILSGLHGSALKSTSNLLPANVATFFSGLLTQQPASACSLQSMLSVFLSLPVKVEQFCGSYLNLPKKELTRIATLPLKANYNRLGKDAMVGSKVWSKTSKFTILIGPVPLSIFNKILPNGSLIFEIVQIAKYYCNNNLDFNIRLLLKKEEVPKCQLSSNRPFSLGWNSWVISKDNPIDRADTNIEKSRVLSFMQKNNLAKEMGKNVYPEA